MKKLIIIAGLFICITEAKSQGFDKLLKKATKDTSLASKANSILSGGNVKGLSNGDIVAGLKEALSQGVTKGTNQLSAVDGFLANAAVKVILPQEAEKVEKTLRNIGMGKMVDDAIVSMNRAAEDAAKDAAPIFINAVKNISVADGFSILKGADTAATGFLRKNTNEQLTAAFRPTIEKSLQKTGATKYWSDLVGAYNKVSFRKINPDLAAYVTDKATYGIFYQIAEEERSIRKNPAARSTELLKKVFN